MKSNPIALAIAMLVLSIALYVGVICPLSSSLLKTQAKLSNEQVRCASIELSLAQQPDVSRRIVDMEKTNAVFRTAWIAPMLNSYAMRAKSLLDTMATEAGMSNVEYEEGAFRALPVPKERVPERRTARRSVRIRAWADYAAIVSFLMRAEKELPMMTLQSLSIKPQPMTGSPDKQEAEFVLEWPSEGEVIK